MTRDERYHQLYEASPTAILTVDQTGHVVDCNRAACVRLARSRRELLGTPVLRWIAREDRGKSKANFLQALRGGTVEWKARVERGFRPNPIMGLRAAGAGSLGSSRLLHVFLTDSAEFRTLQRDAGHLQAALENLPEQFVLLLDADGCIRYAAGMERTLWYPIEECLGRDASFLFAQGAAGRDQLQALRRETAAGRRWEGEIWVVRKDGSRFPAQVVGVPYLDTLRERPVGTLLVARDVTEDHLAAERLARTERLAHIGDVVASVAYELEAPVRRIIAQAAAARDVAGPDANGSLAAIEREAARLDGLVQSLVSFALDNRAERTASDPRAVIEQAILEQQATFEEAGVRVERVLPAKLPEIAIAPEHLRLILRQILTNCREAARLEGKPGRVRIRSEATASGIEIHITDDGVGIREEWRDRIFEPFFTTKDGRFGLGLAIVRGIVSAYGGRVWADRDADTGGATISIALPIEPPSYTAAFNPRALARRRPRSVLVVDDDEGLRRAIRTFLEKLGFIVSEAWSGRSALAQIVSGGSPEVLVTDLRMRDGTGYWLLRELARDFPRLLRRTVILTGDPSHAAVDRISQETGCPVIRKPFDFQVLLDRLDEVASRA